MPLPSPIVGSPPTPKKLSEKAHLAIWDDHSIAEGVRIAVLSELEACADPDGSFKDLANGEIFLGRTVSLADFGFCARAIPTGVFVKGLQLGWFGADMEETAARNVVVTLQNAILRGDPDDKLERLLKALVPYDATHLMDRNLVAWYYFDNSSVDNPLTAAASDLALRLALPNIHKDSTKGVLQTPYFVVRVAISDMDDPRRPRFPDAGSLEFLEFWRPGGLTAPWCAGLLGLDEVVDRPLAIGLVGGTYAFIDCRTN